MTRPGEFYTYSKGETDMQTPTVGRIVHFYEGQALDKPVAALITRVHSDTCVNLTTFGDGMDPMPVSSVELVASTEPADVGGRSMFCIWPPRV